MSTTIVVVFGTLCVACWIVAYTAIIYRGFRDKSYGMPVPALAANLSWEAAYSFVLDPFGDYIHTLSIPCFCIDLIIAVQCLMYGKTSMTSPLLRRWFRSIVVAAVAIAFPVVYLGFLEFHDPAGEYTGFGINFMMSLLFLALLERRPGAAGQSMYIAVFKWLGTFFSYIATVLTVTTSVARPLPSSPWSFLRAMATYNAYPLTHLISVLYLVTFLADLLYTGLLYRRLRDLGITPWRRL